MDPLPRPITQTWRFFAAWSRQAAPFPRNGCAGGRRAESTSRRVGINCVSCPVLGPCRYLCPEKGLIAMTREGTSTRGKRRCLPRSGRSCPHPARPVGIPTAVAHSPSPLFRSSLLSLLSGLGNPTVTIFRWGKKEVSSVWERPGISVQHKHSLAINPPAPVKERTFASSFTWYLSNFLGKVLGYLPSNITSTGGFCFTESNTNLLTGGGSPHGPLS